MEIAHISRLIVGKTLKIAVIALFITAGAFPVTAMGHKNNPLREADKLITQKRFAEAFELLLQMARNYEDYFDSAQKRVRVLFRLTQTYNRLAGILLNTAKNNPENLDEILRLSEQLQEIEQAAHSEYTRNVVSQIYISARFSLYSRELTRIMVEARAFLEKKEFISALQTYQSGFELYRKEFLEARPPLDIENTTNENLQKLSAYTESLVQTVPALRAAAAQLTQIEGTAADKNTLQTVFTSLSQEFDKLIQIKQSVAGFDTFFKQEGLTLETQGANKNMVSYLLMLSFLINGRENQPIREGFFGAYDALWESAYSELETKYRLAAETAYQANAQKISAESYSESLVNIQDAFDINTGLQTVLSKYLLFSSTDHKTKVSIFDTQIPGNKAALYLTTVARLKSLTYNKTAANSASAYTALKAKQTYANTLVEWQSGKISLNAALENESKMYAEFHKIGDVLTDALNAAAADIDTVNDYAQTVTITDAAQILALSQNVLQKLLAKLVQDEQASVIRYYTFRNKKLEESIVKLETTLASADELLRGINKTTETGEKYVARYPVEALEKINSTADILQTSMDDAKEIMTSLESEPPRISREQNFIALQSESQALIRRLEAAAAHKTTQNDESLARISTAELLRQEGDQYLVLARESLKQLNFDEARERTGLTAARYSASLDIQESEALRKFWIEELIPLNVEITRIEYETVVGEIRDMLTKARSLYFNGDYVNAEDVLVRASNRWATVSTEPDSELAYWTSLAHGALTLQSGRNIPVTAPLYKPMSQLLNGAQQNYESGLALINSGKTADGERKLRMAKNQISEVRMLFPINHTAGLLDLRIDQILDKENFERTFNMRFTSAVSETRRGSREAYAEMQNLAEIRPEYPGIQRALYQAEIDIGLRTPPSDSSSITRAAELARRAEGMLNAPSQRKQALDLINESLRLNPNSTLAMNIKDRLQVAIARQNAAVIDRSTEQDYLRAVSELQRGNTIIALSIVQRLLQNPANQNSTKIRNLQRRIEAMM
jgi:hypothetical protein